MKKRFEIGLPMENDTEYFATEKEYHVYAADATRVCDDRYIALRANYEKEFDVFLSIKGKKNVTLDFCGATLVMHGKIQPFLIDSCENITVKNCNVTCDRPPYTEGRIVEVGEARDYVRLRLNENCPCRIEGDRLIPYSDTWENRRLNYNGFFFQLFDGKTRKGEKLHLGVIGTPFVMEKERPFRIRQFTAEQDGEDILLRGEFLEEYRAGQILTLAHEPRSISNLFVIDSKDLCLENYRILSGCGMGIYSYRTENIRLDGFRMTYDSASPCVTSNSADGVHTFGTSGRFEIRNSVFEGMIDDAVNVHSNFRTVEHVCGDQIYAHLASCEQQAMDLYRVGDEIAVYRGKTMEETARYTLKEIRHIGEEMSIFTVDRPVEEHAEGDLIESLTANCELILEDCIFGKANSHLRLQTRGRISVRNCEFELPLLLTGDASYWFESGPVTDLTVENCRFIGEKARIRISSEILPTDLAPYYHKNLKILNNEFETESPLSGGYSDGIVFKGNRNTLGREMTLTLTNCGRVDAEQCRVERLTEKKERLSLN